MRIRVDGSESNPRTYRGLTVAHEQHIAHLSISSSIYCVCWDLSCLVAGLIVHPEAPSPVLAAHFVEIYDDQIRDLLHPTADSSAFRVREHPEMGPYVENVVPVEVGAVCRPIYFVLTHVLNYLYCIVQRSSMVCFKQYYIRRYDTAKRYKVLH